MACNCGKRRLNNGTSAQLQAAADAASGATQQQQQQQQQSSALRTSRTQQTTMSARDRVAASRARVSAARNSDTPTK